MNRFSKGEILEQAEYSLAITAHFECGNKDFAWLNNVVAVRTRVQTRSGAIYQLFEVN